MKHYLLTVTTTVCIIAVLLLGMGMLATETTHAATSKTTKTSFKDQKTTIKLTKAGSGTRITWTAIDGARAYRVYRSYSKNGKYTRLKTIMASSGTLSYKDIKATSGKKAYYKVRAYKGMLNFKTFTKYSAKKSSTVTRVFVVVGHGTSSTGSWDSGCTYRVKNATLTEAGLMLPITKAMVEELRNNGVYVYTDADTGNNKNMLACVAWSLMRDVSAYVSIHCDYYKAKSGTLPLYRTAEGRKLANSLNEGLHSKVSMADRGLSYRSDLYELNMPRVPSCIFETGSISKDYKIFQKQYEAYGAGLAKGLCDYLGVEYTETQTTTAKKK